MIEDEDNYDEPLIQEMKSEDPADNSDDQIKEVRRTLGSTVALTEQELQMIYQHQTGTYTNIF